MIYYIKLYLATLVAFFAMDMLWLGLVASDFYKKNLGFLMAPEVNWAAALVFYLLFILGILVFVIVPGLTENALPMMLVKAAFFGLVTYATYDLTNLATVKNWPLVVTLVDLLWGMFLTTVVSLAGFFAGKWMA